MALFDFHIHSHKSVDSFARIPDIIATARQRNLRGFALSDHDRWRGYLEAKHHLQQESLSSPDPLMFLTGVEITTFQLTRQGVHFPHIVVLNMVESELAAFLRWRMYRYPFIASTQHTLEWVQRHPQALAIAAHPLPFGGVTSLSFAEVEHYAPLLGAMEVINGKSPLENRARAVLARSLGLPMIGSSDAHRASDVGNAATNLPDSVRTPHDVVQAIRNGECEPIKLR